MSFICNLPQTTAEREDEVSKIKQKILSLVSQETFVLINKDNNLYRIRLLYCLMNNHLSIQIIHRTFRAGGSFTYRLISDFFHSMLHTENF